MSCRLILAKRPFSLLPFLFAAVKQNVQPIFRGRSGLSENRCENRLALTPNCSPARFIKVEKAAFGALRTADKHASDKNQGASQAYLQCCRHCRSVHEAMPNPGNCCKLDQHHAEGDNHRHAKSGDQKGQCMTKSTERRHRTTDRAAKPGMSSPSQGAVIRECLRKSHADSCAD